MAFKKQPAMSDVGAVNKSRHLAAEATNRNMAKKRPHKAIAKSGQGFVARSPMDKFLGRE